MLGKLRSLNLHASARLWATQESTNTKKEQYRNNTRYNPKWNRSSCRDAIGKTNRLSKNNWFKIFLSNARSHQWKLWNETNSKKKTINQNIKIPTLKRTCFLIPFVANEWNTAIFSNTRNCTRLQRKHKTWFGHESKPEHRNSNTKTANEKFCFLLAGCDGSWRYWQYKNHNDKTFSLRKRKYNPVQQKLREKKKTRSNTHAFLSRSRTIHSSLSYAKDWKFTTCETSQLVSLSLHVPTSWRHLLCEFHFQSSSTLIIQISTELWHPLTNIICHNSHSSSTWAPHAPNVRKVANHCVFVNGSWFWRFEK